MSDQGILTGPEIAREVQAGNIHIEGFDESFLNFGAPGNPVNPASYDLRLGSKVAVYKHVVGLQTFRSVSWSLTEQELQEVQKRGGMGLVAIQRVLDSKKKNDVHVFTMDAERGWYVNPGIGYLMHTKEAVYTEKYVPIVDGKSSLGRLFVTAHITAGYGDPGYNGEYTLEVVSTHAVILYPGMRFCQIRFHTKVGQSASYKNHRSNYFGALARGPVPSRSWKQFEDDAKR